MPLRSGNRAEQELLGVFADLASRPGHFRASVSSLRSARPDAVEERFIHGMTR